MIRRGEAKGKAPVVPNFENVQTLIARERNCTRREDMCAARLLCRRCWVMGNAAFRCSGVLITVTDNNLLACASGSYR